MQAERTFNPIASMEQSTSGRFINRKKKCSFDGRLWDCGIVGFCLIDSLLGEY